MDRSLEAPPCGKMADPISGPSDSCWIGSQSVGSDHRALQSVGSDHRAADRITERRGASDRMVERRSASDQIAETRPAPCRSSPTTSSELAGEHFAPLRPAPDQPGLPGLEGCPPLSRGDSDLSEGGGGYRAGPATNRMVAEGPLSSWGVGTSTTPAGSPGRVPWPGPTCDRGWDGPMDPLGIGLGGDRPLKRGPIGRGLLDERGPIVGRGLLDERGPIIGRGLLDERGPISERGLLDKRGPIGRGLLDERGPISRRGLLDDCGPIKHGPLLERGPIGRKGESAEGRCASAGRAPAGRGSGHLQAALDMLESDMFTIAKVALFTITNLSILANSLRTPYMSASSPDAHWVWCESSVRQGSLGGGQGSLGGGDGQQERSCYTGTKTSSCQGSLAGTADSPILRDTGGTKTSSLAGTVSPVAPTLRDTGGMKASSLAGT
eukprot:1173934-Prorocentrum_minimum.AAC.1